MPDAVLIRAVNRDDAESIGDLSQQFADYLHHLGDEHPRTLRAEEFVRDAFGPDPAFSGLVAERESGIVGYLLYYLGYEIDEASRILHVVDLYVSEENRRQGIGRKLMLEAGEVCRRLGGRQLFWSVYVHNERATRFYRSLGARQTKDLVFMRLDL